MDEAKAVFRGKFIQIDDLSFHLKKVGGTFKMAEEKDVEITFLPTNTSKIHLHVEQLLQNTY